jgi:hypothetical protein
LACSPGRRTGSSLAACWKQWALDTLAKGSKEMAGLDWTGLDWLVAERHRVKAEFANVFVLQVQRVTGLISKYILRPKIFAHLDFYILHLTIRLIKKICENVKTIMIYLKYI